jgi:plastocyanin
VLLGLTTAQKFGLAGVAFVFVSFALIVSMVIPRYRPDFPGRRHLRLFIATVAVLFVSMLAAVEVFARESEEKEPREGAAANTAEPAPAEPAPVPGGVAEEKTLENLADPSQLRFSKSTLEAPAGKITLVMENPSPLEHDIALKGQGVDEIGKTVGQGGKSTVSADLKPGKYEFYCSVPGHEAAGMKGTLTVTG